VTDDIPAETPMPSLVALLRTPRIARFYLGNFVSNTGNWFQDIAAAILIFQVTGSAAMVAGVAVASYGTSMLLSPIGGQLADHFDRRKLLIITHSGQTVAAAALAALAAMGLADVWTILVLSVVIGVGRALNNPTLQALLPTLVGIRNLAPAFALQSVTFNLARAVGPVLGAIVITVSGPAAAFAVNALTFALFAILLLTIRLDARPRRRQGESSGILGGLSYVRRRPWLIVLLICSALTGMATDPPITLGPAFARSLGEEPGWAGWLVASFGAGAVAVAAFSAEVRSRIGRVRTLSVTFAGAALGLVVLGLAPIGPVALAGGFIAGGSFMIGSADVTATLQELIPDEVRGRVMALWSMGFLGSRPLAALTDGAISDAVSPQAAVFVLGAVLALAGGATALAYARRGGAAAFATTSNG
jgi:MFS family permease